MDRKPKRETVISDEDEAEIQRQIAEDPDDWEATDNQLAAAKPFAEVFPELMESIRRVRGRPTSDNPKSQVTLRLDADVVAKFRASGRGWQSRMNAALRKAAGL